MGERGPRGGSEKLLAEILVLEEKLSDVADDMHDASEAMRQLQAEKRKVELEEQRTPLSSTEGRCSKSRRQLWTDRWPK